jgi:hypothetical protein
LCQVVNNFAFSFIAPLQAEYYVYFVHNKMVHIPPTYGWREKNAGRMSAARCKSRKRKRRPKEFLPLRYDSASNHCFDVPVSAPDW